MKKYYFILISALLFSFYGNDVAAQTTENPFSAKLKSQIKSSEIQTPATHLKEIVEIESTSTINSNSNLKSIPFKKPLNKNGNTFKNAKFEKNGLLMFLEGKAESNMSFSNRNNQSIIDAAYSYLEPIEQSMQIKNTKNEFESLKIWNDELNFTHIKMQQFHMGIKVYGGQIILHGNNGFFNSFNGTYYPTPKIENIKPKYGNMIVEKIAMKDVAKTSTLGEVKSFNIKQLEYEKAASELIIYHYDRDVNSEKLAWHITLRPNFLERWEYFVDANTGEIINKYNNTCSDGPTTANATDLNGVSRNINTYQVGSNYYLIDATKPMFNSSQSSMPDNPVGAILTLNANNTNNENITHVSSSNNNWNDASSVSAHYNGNLTYEYYRNTHNRNSINGEGGTIISIVNVADEDGSSLANAYWNGQAMFYGNGGNIFYPLAGGLDVAAHEMTHGVVQNTANLEYQNESGAINEAMADISGAMVDRSNWQIGETITPNDSQLFPTGTMRDMANPHNGGSSFSDPSYQPMHTSEQYTGSQDNGGVHMNSGIINYAYYLLAESISKNKAEKLFYRALSIYMTQSSQFIDCRLAFEQSAKDIYGNASAEHNAVASSFYAVGIGEDSGTGGGGGSAPPGEISVNPGQDYILSYDVNPMDQNTLYISNTSGEGFVPISTTIVKRKPSIVDNGTVGVMITKLNEMRSILMSSPYSENQISNDLIWDNVAVSKDGKRIAAITTSIDSAIWVYDYGFGQWAKFHLYNPTFTPDVIVENVLYADAIEWDYTGQYLVYDAYNVLENNSGENIDYWDVGFIKVWNNASNNWGDGDIFKLFTGLPESVSIGNPSLSKNTPFILAFDYFNQSTGEVQIMGANLETGDVNTIFENTILGYPNYSKLDDKLVFGAESTDNEVVGVIDLKADKISPNGQATVLIDIAKWPIWYSMGDRDLLDVDENEIEKNILTKVFPNPVYNQLNIIINTDNADNYQINIYNIYGKHILEEEGLTNNTITQKIIDISDFDSGTYVVNVKVDQRIFNHKVVKVD
jgi:Zn-dependent metalloprotease